MLHKLAPLARIASVAARPHGVRCMSYGMPAGFKTDKEIDIDNKNHMDFMPVPQGSWQEHYNKRNSGWNMQLGGTIALFALTVAVMYQTGCLYLHQAPSYKNK